MCGERRHSPNDPACGGRHAFCSVRNPNLHREDERFSCMRAGQFGDSSMVMIGADENQDSGLHIENSQACGQRAAMRAAASLQAFQGSKRQSAYQGIGLLRLSRPCTRTWVLTWSSPVVRTRTPCDRIRPCALQEQMYEDGNPPNPLGMMPDRRGSLLSTLSAHQQSKSSRPR